MSSWYPKLLGLLVSYPLRIDPHQEEVMVAEQRPQVVPLLAVWPISGNTTLVRNFQGRLQTFSCLLGDKNPHNHTTPCARNGSAGVLNGKVNPVSGPIEDVVNFLAHLFHKGYQYQSLNAYRSSIASMHTPVDGLSIGQHPLVSRLLKGAFQTHPPLPRYQGIWDVSIVLHHIGSHCLDHSLTLKQLSLLTVMLLALTCPSWSADLAKLSLKGHRNTPEGALFIPTALAIQSRTGRDIKEFFFPKFTGNEHLCPVRSLNLYIERTRELRGDNEQLFISHQTTPSSLVTHHR